MRVRLSIDFPVRDGSLFIDDREVPVVFDHDDLDIDPGKVGAFVYQRIYSDSDEKIVDQILEAIYILCEKEGPEKVVALCVYDYQKIVCKNWYPISLDDRSVNFDIIGFL